MNQDFISALSSGPCRVVFRKQDGTLRTMLASRTREDIDRVGVRGTGSSSPRVIPVIDLEIGEWRSFRPDSVVSFEALSPAEVG